MISRSCLPRLTMRLICFAAASVLLLPVTPWKSAPRFVLQLSPFAAICSGIALRAIGVGSAIGLLIAAATVLWPRFFCRYVCPAGLLLEGTAKIGFRKISWWRRCPPIGKYAALLTVAGAAVGYPVLLWMDPLAIFSSSFAIRAAAGAVSGVLSGLGLGILILLSIAAGSIWCSRLCPLGGAQDLLASAGSMLQTRHSQSSVETDRASSMRTGSSARRAFIIGAAGVGMGFLARRIAGARGEKAPLRPPGAVDEQRFTGLCMRCGSCLRACPSAIIKADTGLSGITGLLTPIIQYDKKYCLEDCRACTLVCPSGALEQLDMEQKKRYIIGEALVDGSLCLLALGRKDCDACERSCPYDAVHTHWDEERYVAYPVVATDKCNGCGACEVACPTERIKAIRVWKRGDGL